MVPGAADFRRVPLPTPMRRRVHRAAPAPGLTSRADSRRRAGRRGQSMIETSLMIILISLILLGTLQVSRLFVAKEIITHSASAGARAAAVGFNEFMVYKVTRVASIPNAGAMTTPNVPGLANDGFWRNATVDQAWNRARTAPPRDPRRDVEDYRIPEYLGSTAWGQLPGILDYEEWDTVAYPAVQKGQDGDVSVRIRQDFPLRFPFARAFYADDEVSLDTRAELADHARLYLE